jgi:hypothetical protein
MPSTNQPPPTAAAAESLPDPDRELQRFIIEESPPLYVIGTFDAGITVLRQQIRALNLAWTLVETGRFSTTSTPPVRVAVVGAGFAGLTFAAALLKKGVNVAVTLFEEHDTLLPLQQGSDTRWLHPHIYDWPDEGSEADVAMLPLLNWTAARASDVVVQILKEWRRIVRLGGGVKLYCNTRHLQISKNRARQRLARIEWIGEPRDPADGTTRRGDEAALGCSGSFDHVVLAVGFGIEDGQPSYWRNETLGQPNLNQRRRTHLVSGQGDGAMIDLLRLRVSQYRQDRILEEVFAGKPTLVDALREIKTKANPGSGRTNLFGSLDALFGEGEAGSEDAKDVLDRLARRLRRDTDAVLQLKVRDLAELLEPTTSRTSFQNALLLYLLYRVGGFAPSTEEVDDLRERYSIPESSVVRRHGTKRMRQLGRILADPLFEIVSKRAEGATEFAKQAADMLWPGGYFGFPGRTADMPQLTDEILRSAWRKEYLPGPTALVSASICGGILGAIRDMRPGLRHVRVTLHRVLPLHREQLLQQACDYQGSGFDQPRSTAGRTFPAGNAMIGLAYRCRRLARTRFGATSEELQEAMAQLGLHDAARDMMPDISYILAIPVLQPARRFHPPGPVAAVIYLDSKDDSFNLSEAEIDRLVAIALSAFSGLAIGVTELHAGIRNIPFGAPLSDAPPIEELPPGVGSAIELLDGGRTPVLSEPFVLNFDYADPASMEGLDLIDATPDSPR